MLRHETVIYVQYLAETYKKDVSLKTNTPFVASYMIFFTHLPHFITKIFIMILVKAFLPLIEIWRLLNAIY